MKNEKFTPGEWIVEDQRETADKIYDYAITDCKGWYIAHIENCSLEEDEANAYLIAAAPEMYKALEDVCSDCERHSNWEDLFNIGRPGGTQMPPCPCDDCYVKKALKKARGEE